MSSSSPIAAIYQVLQHIQATAQANASIFRKNEAATRAALIDPVLRTLGWDTANVQMVEPEKTLGNELRIDYLLNDPTGRPWVVIEAKCLDSSLDKYGYVGKILGYALALNVHTVCITDGITWHLHTHLQHGKSEPVVFSLLENDLLPAANELIRWLDAAQSGHGIQPLKTSISEALRQESKPASNTSLMPSKSVAKQPSKPRKQTAGTSEFIDVTQLRLPMGQKPKQLRLPNGTIKPINTWKDILLEVCRLVLETNSQLAIPLADKAGKKSFLFTAQKPAKGSSTLASYKGQTIFIYTNYSAEACIANALYASSQIPLSQKLTTLAVSF